MRKLVFAAIATSVLALTAGAASAAAAADGSGQPRLDRETLDRPAMHLAAHSRPHPRNEYSQYWPQSGKRPSVRDGHRHRRFHAPPHRVPPPWARHRHQFQPGHPYFFRFIPPPWRW